MFILKLRLLALYPLRSVSTHIYSLWYTYLDRWTTFPLYLTPLVHFVDQGETEYGGGYLYCGSSPLPWRMGDAYAICKASMGPWDVRGGELGPIGVLPSSLQ